MDQQVHIPNINFPFKFPDPSLMRQQPFHPYHHGCYGKVNLLVCNAKLAVGPN